MPANDNSEMNRLQQDAIRRVQEMQNRARQAAASGSHRDPPAARAQGPAAAQQPAERQHPPEPHSRTEARHPEPPPAEPPTPRHPPENHPQPPVILPGGDGNPLNNILDTLMQDHERTLILILILLLSAEKADTSLILALMYLVI